ncbi:transporter substrate-binding domain-containing protein [Serratia sp. IR-2025]
MQTIPAAVLDDLAPQGVLRAAINYGNPVLAQAGAGGKPQGASVELAAALAQELGVALELVTYDAAGKVFADLDSGAWNLAFMAIEPVRAAQIAFSEPYVIIEGTYLVANDAPYFEVAQLDRPEVRIAVGQGAAYDLFLSRTLQQAQLVRAATSAEAIALFFERGLEAGGGGGGGGPPGGGPPRGRPSRLPGAGGAFHRHPPGDGGAAAKNAGRRLRERFYRALQSQRAGEGGLAAQRPGRGDGGTAGRLGVISPAPPRTVPPG